MSPTFGLCSLSTIYFVSFDQDISRPHFRQISSLNLAHRSNHIFSFIFEFCGRVKHSLELNRFFSMKLFIPDGIIAFSSTSEIFFYEKCWNVLLCLWRRHVRRNNRIQVVPATSNLHTSTVESVQAAQ